MPGSSLPVTDRPVTVPAVVLGGYALVATIACLVTVTETILFYPNVFHDIPDSLARTEEFMSVVGVGDVLRPMGAVLTLVALIAAAVAARYRIARAWTAASLVPLLSGQFLLSVAYQWPRVEILFDDRDRYTVEQLRQAADEFLIGQGLRVGAAVLTALFAVVAALVCYRAHVLRADRLRVEAALS
ncbi:hypothetical protein [Nocardia sp.]|uniref:hypothetical protein n=1 Tax=Nocardia sp. TaxID=1821 RepID=UPI002B4AF204|nr:hypothetical protein [Nocardia sp.]